MIVAAAAPPRAGLAQTAAPGDACAPADASRLAAAASGFAGWVERGRRQGALHFSSNGALEVSEPLSSRFAVGNYGMRFYVGFPRAEAAWMLGMPWLHLGIDRREGLLSVLCDRLRLQRGQVPGFALNFRGVVPEVLRYLANYHYVDVRFFNADSAEPDGELARVSSEVAFVLPVRILDAEKARGVASTAMVANREH